MTRSAYYELVKQKAREIRSLHGLNGPRVTLTDMRKIYRAYNIKIDYWKGKLKRVRGAYSLIDGEPCVMVAANLPDEQKIFTLAHELKHHFFDRAESEIVTDHEPTEIGAEIFAVELIFPDQEFVREIEKLGVKKQSCTRIDIVRLKHDSNTTLSYTSLAKRAEFLGYAPRGSLGGAGWIKLRDEHYGEPVYKRVQRFRKLRAKTSL